MKLCRIDQIQEGSILARDVYSKDYQVLLKEGTILKEEYINKLKDFRVSEAYISEPKSFNTVVIDILKIETEATLKEKVRTILEKHTYRHSEDLKEISNTADEIITNILEEEQVVEKVLDIKERSADIYEHSIMTCSLSIILAIKMSLPKKEIHDIGVASLLHDLGLRYLTIEYNNQALEILSGADLIEFKKHPVYGYTALKDEQWLTERCKNIILFHQERMDGSGYPLHATEITKECQIVSICDEFDEMICGIGCIRMKVHEAIEKIKLEGNITFTKEVVEMFLNFIAVYPVGSIVKTSNGEIAVVISQNNHFPDRPILQIIKDAAGNRIEENNIVDLLKSHTVFIEKVIN